MKQALIYSLKVWLTTAILSPIATGIELAVTQQSGDKLAESITFYFASVVYGLVFSLIPFLFMWLVVRRLVVKLSSVQRVRLIIFVLAEALLVASMLWLVSGNTDSHPVYLIIPYSVILALSIWLYKLPTLLLSPSNQ